MKLELDINSARNSTLDNYSDNQNDSKSDEVKKTLRLGINLAKDGNRPEARQMLMRVTEAEPNNETAWLWLASISEYPEELLVFLQNVLKINPENERALEWSKQTKTLLSKTFVQRGINASRDNQKDFAKQCFLQGIVHDSENEMAWLWLASSADSQEEKVSHLQRVLKINPENETALSSLSAVKSQMSQSLLKKANSAAILGERENAKELLEEIMKHTPNLEEAWTLKAYLASEYYEKIECYQKALEINPENEAALAGLSSLQALALKVSKPVVKEVETVVEETVEPIEEVLEQLEEPTETFEEFEQPFEKLADEVVFEELHQTVEQTENQEVLFETPLVQAENELAVEASQPQTEFFVEEQTQKDDESLANEEPQTHEVYFVEQQPQAEAEHFTSQEVELQVETTPFTQAEMSIAEENQPQVKMEVSEPADSPTQELDEDYALTAEAVFNSLEQSETVPEEDLEVSSELQTEPQTFASVFETLNEENVVEQTQAEELQTDDIDESDVFLADEATETAPTQEVAETESTLYQSPYFNNSGFESVPASEVFADYKQPTVEFTYSEIPTEPVSELEETPLEESVPAESIEFATESQHENQVVEETVEVVEEAVEEVQTQTVSKTEVQTQFAQCPFCESENEVQSIVCHSCNAMLSLSDLEMLLTHQGANQDLMLAAIEVMEVEKTLHEFSVEELTKLGVAYFNAKNLRKGLSYLQEASQLNPNDVIFASKVNFLSIRLNEIEEHDQKAQENPVQSRTILVVDDSPTVRKLISGKLEKCGHSVISAIDGMDALAKINEVIPDLILLDITMPRLDGYQVCKLIRNNDVTKDIPIVMISGKDGFFDKVRGRMAGSTGYITKPFGPDTLMKTIENYLT